MKVRAVVSKIFLTSKFSYFTCFLSLLPKHEKWLQINGRLLIWNQMDESDRSTNQKQGATIRSYLLHSSLGAVLGFILPFANMLDQKHWTKLACFDLSSSNFNMQGYILSTGGVALRRFQHPFIFLGYLLEIQMVFQNSFRSLLSKSGK